MKKSKAKKASPRSINAVDIYIGARMRERNRKVIRSASYPTILPRISGIENSPNHPSGKLH
jgi:hypothetical protein